MSHAISPLGHRAGETDRNRPAAERVALVEDRLSADRRNMPAPPSHRTRAPKIVAEVEVDTTSFVGSPFTGSPSADTTTLSPLSVSGTGLYAGSRSVAVAERPTSTPWPAEEIKRFGPPEHDPEVDPYRDGAEGRLSLGRRIARGVLVVGLVAAVAAVLFVMPEDDGANSVETAAPTAEGDQAPIARAEMLDVGPEDQVDVSLESSENLNAIGLAAFAFRPGSPADTPAGFDAVVTDVVEEATAPTTTTTIAWVEPTMPPESEWVDGGNGVAVPDLLLRIRFCESTNNYAAANSGSSARGAYQFLSKSWDWYGHAAITGVTQAHLATPAQQDEAALRTLQAEGTGPWAESRRCWSDPNIDPAYATAKPPQPTTTVPAENPDGEENPGDGGEATTTSESPTTTAPDTETTVEGSDTTVDESTTTTTEGSTTTTVTTTP